MTLKGVNLGDTIEVEFDNRPRERWTVIGYTKAKTAVTAVKAYGVSYSLNFRVTTGTCTTINCVRARPVTKSTADELRAEIDAAGPGVPARHLDEAIAALASGDYCEIMSAWALLREYA